MSYDHPTPCCLRAALMRFLTNICNTKTAESPNGGALPVSTRLPGTGLVLPIPAVHALLAPGGHGNPERSIGSGPGKFRRTRPLTRPPGLRSEGGCGPQPEVSTRTGPEYGPQAL